MTYKICIITIFPDLFRGFVSSSLIHKAQEKGIIEISFINPRDFADPPHFQVDDTPYGGGAGMVMKPEPLAKATVAAKQMLAKAPVILMSPRGEIFKQSTASDLSKSNEIILVCGRYEGIDERYIERYVDREISIGDFVLMGGEVAAMAVIEASARLIVGVLGNEDSVINESFSKVEFPLEAPQYTRPSVFEGLPVPAALLSGNHAEINLWREQRSEELTKRLRPDLFRARDSG